MATTRKLVTGLLMAILCVTLIAVATVTLKGSIASASNDDSSDYGIATVASTSNNHTWKHTNATVVPVSGRLYGSESADKPVCYYLESDMQLTEGIYLTGYVELCLNGYKLETAKHSVIDIESADDGLVLYDCCEGKACGNAKHQHIINDKTIYGGVITGGEGMSSGGGVRVLGGTFTMTGGTITGNKAKTGGGVYVGNGTFTMTGGIISGNTATTSGGGVYYAGTFTMTGGTISDNTATTSGGGVYLYNGTFEMTGGTISGNTAGVSGGGVYVRKTFNVSGKAIVTNNTNLTSGVADNVYLTNNTLINVTDKLVDGAQFGVTLESTDGVFTSGYSTYNSNDPTSQFFFNDSDKSASICKKNDELIFAEHKASGIWALKGEGDANASRTQAALCSVCSGVTGTTRDLELFKITVDAQTVYNAKETLEINGVTAYFKVKNDSTNAQVDSCLVSAGQYSVSAYANGSYLTSADKSFTVSYTVGGVTKSTITLITVISVQEDDAPLGTYTRAAWHEGQAPSDVTFAGFQSGLSYQLEYYKDQQLSIKYAGNMDQTAPAGTYYVKATTAGNDNYYPYSGCIGSFTISAHDWGDDWQVTAGEHYKECNYFGCAVEQRANHTTNDSNYKSVANHGDEGHWLTCNVCSEKYNQETHNWDGMQWQQDVSYHYKKCEICEQEKTENHNTSGSAYTDNSNEDYHWLVCKVCSAEVNKNSHSWNGIWKPQGDKHYQECDICYAQDLQDHNTSGSTYQDANNHNESAHWLICRTCRAEVEKVTHDWSNVQYISDGKTQHHQECPICAESKASEAHSIASYTLVDNGFHKGDCELCSEQDIQESHVANADYKASENHDMNGHWLRCNVCNEKYNETTHVWDDEWQPDDDNHYQECDVCGQVKEENHDWNDGVITSDATASEDGVRTYTCEKCGAIKTEAIPATGEVEVPKDDPSDAPVKDPANSNPPADEPEEKKIDLVVVIAIAVGAAMLIAAAVAIIVKKKKNASNAQQD